MKKKVSPLLNIESRKCTKNQHSLRDYVLQSLYFLQLVHSQRNVFKLEFSEHRIFFNLLAVSSYVNMRHLKGVLAGAVNILKLVTFLGVFYIGYCFFSLLIGTNSLVKGTKV